MAGLGTVKFQLIYSRLKRFLDFNKTYITILWFTVAQLLNYDISLRTSTYIANNLKYSFMGMQRIVCLLQAFSALWCMFVGNLTVKGA